MRFAFFALLLGSFVVGCGSSSSDDKGGTTSTSATTSTGATVSTSVATSAGTGTLTGTPTSPFVFACMESDTHCRNYHCSGTCDDWMAKKQAGCEAPLTEPCKTEGAVQRCTVTANVNGALTTMVNLYYVVSTTRESACKTAGGTFETL